MPQNNTSNERLLLVCGEHWIKYVAPTITFLALVALSLLLFYIAGTTAYHTEWASYLSFVFALTTLLVTHHWFFMMLLSESTTHILVTSKRVLRLREKLLVQEEMFEISYEKMKTVEARKHGLLQTIFRYGTLSFETGVTIRYVPHPNKVAKEIEQAMGLK